MRFAGKKVFVTGASRGIGNAIAAMFRAEGAMVTGTRTAPGAAGMDACDEWVLADFSDIGQIRSCAEFVRQAEPDVLVNNAGINRIAPFAEIDPDDFQLIQQVNVFAPFLLCRSALPSMARKRWGRIVNVSSIWGKISKAHRASYSASKFAGGSAGADPGAPGSPRWRPRWRSCARLGDSAWRGNPGRRRRPSG